MEITRASLLSLAAIAASAMAGTSLRRHRRKRVKRERTPEQRLSHEIKLYRRRERWFRGLSHNNCVSYESFYALTH